MTSKQPRINREKKTLEVMIALYCRRHHGEKQQLCPECLELSEYALRRLQKCRFGERKPTCARCPVHCYKPEMREKIRGIMRFSGPRMIYTHPVLAILHLIDGRGREPIIRKE